MSQRIPITVAYDDGHGYGDHFQPVESGASQSVTHALTTAGYDIVETETIRTFDGQQGFRLAQGQ